MSRHESLRPLKMLLFSYNAANTIIISFLPLYLRYKGLNNTEIGWVLAIGPFAAILSQPFWGYLSDKYKTVKKILIICIISLLMVSIIFFQMNGLIAILIMAGVFFFFSSPINALGDSMAQRRAIEMGVTFGSIRTWGAIGFATSALIIGELLSRTGVQHMIWPYLFFGGVTLFIAFKLTDVKVTSDPVQFKDVFQLLKNKPFIIYLVLIILLMMTHRANDSFIGLYITELGGSEALIGLAWFIGVISEAAVYAFSVFWFRKYHPLIFVIIAGVLFSIRWFIYATIDIPLFIVSLQFLHGLTFGIFYIASFDYISRLIPNTLQSTGHLVFFAVFFGVSGIIGSLMGGVLFENFGGSTLYVVMGILATLGTGFIILYRLSPIGKTTQTKAIAADNY